MASFLDVCRFLATSSGTGDFVVSAAVQGYQTPAAANAVNGAIYRYRAESSDLTQWEIGYGAYTVGSVTLARTTVLFNSAGTTAKISFSAAPQVGVVFFAEDILSIVPPQGRGSLTSGVAITSSDVTGATVAYYVMPTGGGMLPLRDGAGFRSRLVGQLSNDTTQSSTGNAGPAAVTTNSIYDFFAWDNAGVATLTRGPPWASDTSRGTGAGTTEIDFTTIYPTNKVAITNGPAAGMGVRLFSARSDGSSQLRDTKLFRWVSDAFNLAERSLVFSDTSGNNNYSSTTVRQWAGNAAAQVDMLFCDAGRLATLDASCNVSNSGTTEFPLLGIGIDSTTVNSAQSVQGPSMAVAGAAYGALAGYVGYPGLGRHTGVLLQSAGGGVGTSTWIAAAVLPATIKGRFLN